MTAPARASWGAVLLPALASSGLALIVIGTFLPWLRSGQRLRNSYETDGAIRRLLIQDGVAHTLLAVWPAIGFVCAVLAALFALGRRTVAFALTLLVAVIAAAVAIGALTAPNVHVVTVARLGPIVTLVGAAVCLLAVSMRFTVFVRDDRRDR